MHAANGAVGFEVHVETVRVDDVVLDVDAFDESDDESVFSDFQGAPFGTLKADGGIGDAWRTDANTWRGGEVEVLQLADARWQGGGRSDHGFGEGVVGEIDDELAGATEVASGVFGDAGFAIARSKGEDRRLAAKDIEEAEGRGIDAVVLIQGRDPSDGPWRDKSRQEFVGVLEVLSFEIEFHEPIGPRRCMSWQWLFPCDA